MSEGAAKIVRFREEEGVGIVEFQREPQNRVNRSFFEDLSTAIDRAETAGVRALLVRSSGPDFSRGGDFREWTAIATHAARRERFGFSNRVLGRLEALPVPTVCAVHGNCFGGGFELALHTDVVVAARSARFRFPEATVAVPPLAGGAQRVAERAGRQTAVRLVMLSEEIGAEEAARLNLVARVVDDADLEDVSTQIARALAQGPTRAHAATKMLLAAWAAGGVAAADVQMIEIIANVLATDDVAAGVAAATVALESGTARPVLAFEGR